MSKYIRSTSSVNAKRGKNGPPRVEIPTEFVDLTNGVPLATLRARVTELLTLAEEQCELTMADHLPPPEPNEGAGGAFLRRTAAYWRDRRDQARVAKAILDGQAA